MSQILISFLICTLLGINAFATDGEHPPVGTGKVIETQSLGEVNYTFKSFKTPWEPHVFFGLASEDSAMLDLLVTVERPLDYFPNLKFRRKLLHFRKISDVLSLTDAHALKSVWENELEELLASQNTKASGEVLQYIVLWNIRNHGLVCKKQFQLNIELSRELSSINLSISEHLDMDEDLDLEACGVK